VASVVYDHSDEMALRFRKTRNSAIMDVGRFERAAEFADIRPSRVRKEIALTVEQAADTWGRMLRDLPMPRQYSDYLLKRTQRLALVKGFEADFLRNLDTA
jgi:serine/threonine-protein kinase HipA